LTAIAQNATAEKRYPLANRGFLQMNVPAGWTEKVDQPPTAAPPTISFGARDGKAFIVTVTPAWKLHPGDVDPTKENLRQRVAAARDGIAAFAVETDIKLTEFNGASGPGFYFFATDKEPRPGEYKFMTQGALAVNELTVTFTILTNEGQENVVRSALAMIRGAVHLPK
jgi:hypothetical protein